MLVQTVMQHFYPDDFAEKCIKGGAMSPIAYVCALITVEGCCLLGVHVSYISKCFKTSPIHIFYINHFLDKVWKFNKTKAPPDVQREDWENCSAPENFGQSEVGYRQLGDKVYEFLERQVCHIFNYQGYPLNYFYFHQADLIRHLKEHNSRLSEKLVVLSAQLQQARAGN